MPRVRYYLLGPVLMGILVSAIVWQFFRHVPFPKPAEIVSLASVLYGAVGVCGGAIWHYGWKVFDKFEKVVVSDQDFSDDWQNQNFVRLRHWKGIIRAETMFVAVLGVVGLGSLSAILSGLVRVHPGVLTGIAVGLLTIEFLIGLNYLRLIATLQFFENEMTVAKQVAAARLADESAHIKLLAEIARQTKQKSQPAITVPSRLLVPGASRAFPE